MVTCVARHAQPVVVCFVCHCKRVVLCVSRVPVQVLQLNSQCVVGLTCQSVDVVQPEPELAAQVTEALFAVGPISVEIDGAIESFLENSPAPSFCGLVAENVEGVYSTRSDRVDPAGPDTRFVVSPAVLNWVGNAGRNQEWSISNFPLQPSQKFYPRQFGNLAFYSILR